MDYSLLTEQKISEKYESLSQDLKDVLSLVSTTTAIENIATKYRLDEEKTTMLIQLVGLIILGFVSFENMKEEMKEIIDISPQFIPLIADEIRQKIFLPMMDSLQKVIIEKRPLETNAINAPTTPTSTPTPARPVDEYREPTVGPEVVDLRKIPPSPAEAGYGGQRPPAGREGGLSPGLPVTPKSVPPMPTLTPKPIIPTPLIEAEPHKIPTLTPKPTPTTPQPQYIMRPSGLPPTDLPDNVLDLRKDRGEF